MDAGLTSWGLESTIVRIVGSAIEILRPGAVTEEELAKIASTREVTVSEKILAPGQTAKSHAPTKPVHLFESGAVRANHAQDALICWGPTHHLEEFSIVRSRSETGDLRVAAQKLFTLLREMNQSDIHRIFVEPVPEIGLGKAIMNRLRRATAAGRLS